jgi:hypothetical protein
MSSECDPARLLRRLHIKPCDLHASWNDAHKRQEFGDTIGSLQKAAERAAEFAPWKWPKVYQDVREGLKQTKLAHAASQKLAEKVYSTVSALGEGEHEVQGAILRLLKEIQADDDPGVRLLRSSLKTDALETIFPAASMQTLTSYWSVSKDGVERSIQSSPPPALDGVDVEGEALDALGKAKMAFGAVMGTAEQKERWVRARKKARFGSPLESIRDAASWLRDRVLHTFSLVWKHVARFALIGTMIAAVVLTYCAIMGRDYQSEYAFEGSGDSLRMIEHANLKASYATAGFGDGGVVSGPLLVAAAAPVVAAAATTAAAATAATATTVAVWSYTALAGLFAVGTTALAGATALFLDTDYMRQNSVKVHGGVKQGQPQRETVGADKVVERNKEILKYSLDNRTYTGGMCQYVWKLMDQVVGFFNNRDLPWIAQTVDSFFQKSLADASAETKTMLYENSQRQAHLAGLRSNHEAYTTQLNVLKDTDRYMNAAAEIENSNRQKAVSNDILAQGGALPKTNGVTGSLDMKQKGVNYAVATGHSTTFRSDTSSLEKNNDFPQQLEAMHAWHAIRSSSLKDDEKTILKNKLIATSRHHLYGFLANTSNKVRVDAASADSNVQGFWRFVNRAAAPETLKKSAPQDDQKFLAYIDSAYDEDNLSGHLPEAVKLMRTQAIGLSSWFGAMQSTPGLSFVGDALGINQGASTESKAVGTAILGGIFLAWYLVGPLLASAFVVSIGAFAFAYKFDDGKTFGLHGSAVLGATVFVGLFQLIPEVTSDQAHNINALVQLAMQASGDVHQFRTQAANAQYQAMQAKSAADAARAGAFASAAAGIAAGVASGGNPMAMTAAATAGGNLVTNIVAGEGARAAGRVLAQSRTYFGEYV